VWLDGRRLDQLGERALARVRRQSVGFVFQAFHLMDELTVQENVELPVTEGSWIRNGGVVVERTFAAALGVHTGDSIMLNGRPLNVVGIAVTLHSVPTPRSAPMVVI
jgi:predicted ABC-type transport system involved in lysophospholipase L1 biosynthesis ATPase subunit